MSRTIDELLTEALVHFDAATEYAQMTDRGPRMILDAMSMRLFVGLETLTRLPGASRTDCSLANGPTCEAFDTGSPTAMAPSA